MAAAAAAAAGRPWFARSGVGFGCTQCGKCCSGGSGYVWVGDVKTRQRLADRVGVPLAQFESTHCRKAELPKQQQQAAGSSASLFHQDRLPGMVALGKWHADTTAEYSLCLKETRQADGEYDCIFLSREGEGEEEEEEEGQEEREEGGAVAGGGGQGGKRSCSKKGNRAGGGGFGCSVYEDRPMQCRYVLF